MKPTLTKIATALNNALQNKEIKNLVALLLGVTALFATTLLLDLAWVQRYTIRQILVYAIMAGETFILWANIKTINK